MVKFELNLTKSTQIIFKRIFLLYSGIYFSLSHYHFIIRHPFISSFLVALVNWFSFLWSSSLFIQKLLSSLHHIYHWTCFLQPQIIPRLHWIYIWKKYILWPMFSFDSMTCFPDLALLYFIPNLWSFHQNPNTQY